MSDHVLLVAFHVHGGEREEAQRQLLSELIAIPLGPGPHGQVQYLESWWVAEDDRLDGSDNDSAVFVDKGVQTEAFEALLEAGLTQPWNRIGGSS